MPAPAPGGAPAPAPARSAAPLDLNSVLSRPAPARASNPFGPAKLPVDTSATPGDTTPRRAMPSMLGGGTSGGFGSPPGLGGSLSGLGDLSGTRPAAPEAPAERPTIPLRRPEARLPQPPPAAAAAAMAGPPATGAAGAPEGVNVAVAVEAAPVPAWSPLDDDIIPRTAAKQSFRLRR